MSGHSKWSTIKRKKGATDAKRGKIFTRLIKEITVLARMGGGDPDGNPRLRSAIATAKAENMPKDNIERAIKKGIGDLDGAMYEEIVYEGYGPGGVAVLTNCLTDNKNRTVADVRYCFNKNGGNLAESGCVAFLFDQRGMIQVDKSKATEEQLMDIALEAGAEDIIDDDDDFFQILTAPEDFNDVREALEKNNIELLEASVTMLPQTTVEITDEKVASRVIRLMDALEDNEDVQNVYANFDIADEIMEALS